MSLISPCTSLDRFFNADHITRTKTTIKALCDVSIQMMLDQCQWFVWFLWMQDVPTGGWQKDVTTSISKNNATNPVYMKFTLIKGFTILCTYIAAFLPRPVTTSTRARKAPQISARVIDWIARQIRYIVTVNMKKVVSTKIEIWQKMSNLFLTLTVSITSMSWSKV